MVYDVTFQYMCIMYDDQIKVIATSFTPNIYHFFEVGALKILSISSFEIFNYLLLIILLYSATEY
jgi:hypothetical protein